VDVGGSPATVATGSVEWVTAELSLDNVPDLTAAVSAVRRVLVPGGIWSSPFRTRASISTNTPASAAPCSAPTLPTVPA
jgi:ubiquinone/menaquinone biosynthesis C-methylase UbiE